MEKSLKITDLYLHYNYEYNSDDKDFDDDLDEPHVGYYLSTSKERNGCTSFIVVFYFGEPIMVSIEVVYYNVKFEHFLNYNLSKYKKTNNPDEMIFLSINGTNGVDTEDYKEENIKYIIPLDQLINL